MAKPIISVVGKSGAGKTTYLEKLIPELKARGYRVGVIKHDVHDFDIDRPGKDSWRLAQAGSDCVVISGPRKLALISHRDEEATLAELAGLLVDVDIIITEGYKRQDKPKIEISRREISQELLCRPEELVAVVADQYFDLRVPQFGFEDVGRLTDLLEELFLGGHNSDEQRHEGGKG